MLLINSASRASASISSATTSASKSPNGPLLDGVGASECSTSEYSATELRRILQELFPHRRLVLSQFTFYNQVGVARPTGETFRRKRRCYRLLDILPIACIIALKEQGIPLKNIASVPGLVQEHSRDIFNTGRGCRLSGMGDTIHLHIPGRNDVAGALANLLESEGDVPTLFWGFDVGELSEQLSEVVARLGSQQLSSQQPVQIAA